jgi:Holliday junction DNA helicase RuvA
MISQLTGTIHLIDKQKITVFAGPFGFDLSVPNAGAFPPHEAATIFVHMHWNQENGPAFFGFATELDRTVFNVLTDCSGIGPKIGLAVLADLGADGFLHAIEMGDERMLSKVNGIGAKKAEHIIFQLKGKVANLLKSGIKIEGAKQIEHLHTVAEALESLNYSRPEITRTMNHLKESLAGSPEVPFDVLMRQALAHLSK